MILICVMCVCACMHSFVCVCMCVCARMCIGSESSVGQVVQVSGALPCQSRQDEQVPAAAGQRQIQSSGTTWRSHGN